MTRDDERIIEHGSRLAGSLRVRLVILALAVATVVVVSVLVSGGPGRTPGGAAPAPTPTTASGRLSGVGPFVLYEVEIPAGDDSEYEFRAVDLGAPESEPIRLGIPPGDSTVPAAPIQVWGTAVPVVTTDYVEGSDATVSRIWWLSRKAGFDDAPIFVDRDILGWMAAVDARELLAITNTPGDDDRHDAIIVPADGSTVRRIAQMPPGGSKSEGEDSIFTPVLENAEAWLGIPICYCDYAFPAAWYSISSSGTVSRVGWLDAPTDTAPSVSADGRRFAFVEERLKDCSTPESFDLCPDGPARVHVADFVERTDRVIAEYPNDLSFMPTAMSPDGARVAASRGGHRPLHVIDVESGRVLASVRYAASDLTPVAFIDENTLLMTGTVGPDLERTQLLLVRLETAPTVTVLAPDIAAFWGWIR